MEKNNFVKEMANSAGKTFREMTSLYSDMFSKEAKKEEPSLKQRIMTDLSNQYSKLGIHMWPCIKKNELANDQILQEIVGNIEKLKKNLKDLSEVED